jgi:hypothetical protein
MGRQQFMDELRRLGYAAEELSGGRVSFAYEIPVGRLTGQPITLGLVVPDDFPVTPPSGPHVSPRLLPMNPNSGTHPNAGVHESQQFGGKWQYWSRPFPDWAQSGRTVKAYMAHIRRLFDTL